MRKLLIVFAFLAGLMPTHPALACSCVTLESTTAYQDAKAIVLVRVAAIEKTPEIGPWKISLVVVKSWKDPSTEGVILQAQTPGPRQPCGFFIDVGDQFLVYQYDSTPVKTVALCNTVRGDAMPEHIRALDEAFGAPHR